MPAPFKWTEKQREEMIIAYQKGEGVLAIAKRFHVRHESVSLLLKERGINLRTHQGSTICNDAYFTEIDTEEKAYWLGFLTADGCITTDNRISIRLSSKDVQHLYKFRNALNASQKVSQNERACQFVICSPKMVADLASHGILPRKTFSIKPADIVPELARHYWRGVIDGDGYISKDRGKLTLVGSYEIVLGFQKFVFSHYAKVKACVTRKENIYQLQLHGAGIVRRMLEVLYEDATVYLERKYERARSVF
jgi:intein-encoded DNA endonuclease-like protein